MLCKFLKGRSPMKRSVSRLTVSGFLAFALTSGSASAQTSAGALVGLVRDPAAAAIPGAAVTVTNTQTNVSSRLETDVSGNYFVPSVTPGIYSVTCEHPGFKRGVRRAVDVNV